MCACILGRFVFYLLLILFFKEMNVLRSKSVHRVFCLQVSDVDVKVTVLTSKNYKCAVLTVPHTANVWKIPARF
jgi:hypothetical protein